MKKYLLILLLLLITTGCVQTVELGNTNISVETDLNTNRSYQEEWQELEEGVMFKEMPIYSDNDILHDVVTVFKFESEKFNFSLQQDTKNPKTVSEWSDEYNSLFVCNGGYFAEDFSSTSLLKINGQKYGSKLTADSVGDIIIDENNDLKIYVDTETGSYDNLLQSYPLLARPDEVNSINEDSGQTAPRSVVAKDNDGNVLFIFTQSYYFSLYKLQNYLNKSDLDLKIALNLDGGPSSGYYFQNDQTKISESAEVPNVIMVNQK